MILGVNYFILFLGVGGQSIFIVTRLRAFLSRQTMKSRNNRNSMKNMKNLASGIADWVRNYATKAGKEVLVVGISGGIDSAVAAKLCEMTGLRTICVSMPATPDGVTTNSTIRAINQCRQMEIELIEADIGTVLDNMCLAIDTWTNNGPVDDSNSHKLRRGNLAARIRANVLYDTAATNNGLVVGTSNLDEIEIGYLTKGGDGLVDLEPLAGLHKRQVRELARYLEISSEIIDAAPSAELWDGQTDEQELGMTYDELAFAIDYIHNTHIDTPLNEQQAVVVEKVRQRMQANNHKTSLPPVFPLQIWKIEQDLCI